MKRLTAKKIEQLHFALHYVLDSDDIPPSERTALESQMELLHQIYQRLTGSGMHQ